MRLLAIDPGPTESAFIVLNDGLPTRSFNKIPCADLMEMIRSGSFDDCEHLAIEMVESFGMAVGSEVFETVFWAGRFVQEWEQESVPDLCWSRVYRKEAKMHLCQSMRAKDANIRQALIDKFGGSSAVGKKKNPGPLYGISGDVWSALAIGVTFLETKAVTVNV